MATSTKHTGKTKSILEGMILSAMVSIITTVILSLLIANYLNCEKITWEQAGYWIMGMLYTASFLGGKIAIYTLKRKRFAVALMAGAVYWAVLLSAAALFFGGSFDAVWETVAIILAGCGTAGLLSVPKQGKGRKKPGKSVVKLNKN